MNDYTALIVFGVIMGGVVIYLFRQSRDAVNLTNAIKHVQVAYPISQDLVNIGEMAVLSAEEWARKKKEGGEYVLSEDKLRYAFNFFRKYIPASRGITDEDALEIIHSFVPWANSLGANVVVGQVKEAENKPMGDENVTTTRYP